LLLPRPEAERRDVSGKPPGGIEGAQEIRASFSAQSQGSQDGVETSAVLGEFAKSVGQARRAYLRLMGDRRGSGHQPDYYHVHDQRFLGDQRFVEQIDERIRAEREIEIPNPRASFSNWCV